MNIEVKNTVKPVDYAESMQILEQRVQDVLLDKKDEFLWIIEHTHVYTAGTSSKDTDLLDEKLNVIINTTPVNVFDNNKTYKINPKTWGFDIVYRPREGSGFLKFFDPKNRIQGIQMLVYQAAPCFNRWFGIKPDVDEHIFKHLYEILQENK